MAREKNKKTNYTPTVSSHTIKSNVPIGILCPFVFLFNDISKSRIWLVSFGPLFFNHDGHYQV